MSCNGRSPTEVTSRPSRMDSMKSTTRRGIRGAAGECPNPVWACPQTASSSPPSPICRSRLHSRADKAAWPFRDRARLRPAFGIGPRAREVKDALIRSQTRHTTEPGIKPGHGDSFLVLDCLGRLRVDTGHLLLRSFSVRHLASTIFNRIARLRIDASLRFRRLAIFGALSPQLASFWSRSSSSDVHAFCCRR